MNSSYNRCNPVYLVEIGCSEAQGFLFGKPLTADIITQLLMQEPYAAPTVGGGLHGNRHRTH